MAKYENLSVDFLKKYFENVSQLELNPTVNPNPKTEGYAQSLIFKDGSKIQCYESKSFVPQGKLANELTKILEKLNDWYKSQKIFIDYAFKNKTKKDELKGLLETLGFEVLVMEDMTNGTQSLLSKLEGTLYQADYGLVLLSADDQLIDGKYLPRQNVMLELGMLLSHLKDKGDKRLTIINYDSDKLEIPSDILGIAYVPYKVETFEQDLLKELSHLYPKFD